MYDVYKYVLVSHTLHGILLLFQPQQIYSILCNQYEQMNQEQFYFIAHLFIIKYIDHIEGDKEHQQHKKKV